MKHSDYVLFSEARRVRRLVGLTVLAMIAGLVVAQDALHDRMADVVLWSAMPSDILGYVLGRIRYRFRTYMAVLAITEMSYAMAVVYLGEADR